MLELVTSGAYVRIALAAIAIEAVLLLVLARRLALRPADIAGQLGAGALLLLALELALHGADPLWVAAAVTASLPLHVLDLRRRLAGSRLPR